MEKLQILDTDRIDMLFGGDLSMVQEIYSIASDDFPVTADRLFEALTANDLEAAAGFAHTLKGSISNVGGERASRIADKIQQAAMQQDLSACTTLYPVFRTEMESFLSTLKSYSGLED
ncbi:MAG: Hpt domain-containing protein [Spirochaetia bacterium]|nr:Hpt domain-containing protein [Spirochaetia bacterium]MCF7941747.1 Hpt domain-containing protein [Spirochaetia bacterium]